MFLRRPTLAPWLSGIALAVCLLANTHTARAEALRDVFRGANEAYFRGDFAAAVKGYQRLVDAGIRDADVYFNLGIASARQDELGTAILNLERAARLRPGDSETNAALETARGALGKRIAQAKGEATIQAKPPISEALVRSVHEDTLAILLLIFDVAFFGLLLVYPRLRSDAKRTTAAVAATACGALLAISGTGLFLKRGGQTEGKPAVVLREAELREGPDRHARQRAAAHEGVTARVLANDGSFVRVKIPGGPEGWMAARDVGVIEVE